MLTARSPATPDRKPLLFAGIAHAFRIIKARCRSNTRGATIPALASIPKSSRYPTIKANSNERITMPREIITTSDAPDSPLYSQGVKAGPFVLVSGIVGIDPGTGRLAGGTIQEQTRQALENCQAILRAGDASLADILEVGILLANPTDFAGLNEEYARWFPSEPPTRYVAKLGVEVVGLLVSIRMTAFVT
jgi:reactive intermediate/imine deaminase